MDFGEIFKSISPTIKEMAISYAQKDANVDNLTWLTGTLVKHLPEGIKQDLASQTGQEILTTIDKFSANMASIEQASAEGKSKEIWLRNQINSMPNMTMQQKGEYLTQATAALNIGNQAMENVMQTPGMVNLAEEGTRLMQESESVNLATGNEQWNQQNIKALVQQVGQQTELVGANGMMMPMALKAGIQAGEGEGVIIQQDVLEAARGAAIDQGLKMVAAAALKAGVAAGKIPFLSKALPVSAITNVACVGVESVKSIGRLATGKLSARQAAENIGRASVAAIADFCATGIPARFLMPIPVVGPAMSLAVGGYLCSLSGQQIQQHIYTGLNKISSLASNTVNSLRSVLFGKEKIIDVKKLPQYVS